MNTALVDDLNARAARDHLKVVSTFGVWAFLGPLEPGFWPHFKDSPEWNDGQPDPMDRWSKRVIDQIGQDVRAAPQYPFGTPQHPQFFDFARQASGTWASPVGMLVGHDAGLMISYRGALDFDRCDLSQDPQTSPCPSCAQPCLTACPVGALTSDGYDVPTCKAFLTTDQGSDCLNAGCLVRRSCPISKTYPRDPEQSGYHMRRFLG